MSYTQDNCFMRIDTPLGSDALLLRKFAGEEAVSRPFHFHLELLSLDPAINYDDIVGQNVTITMELADGEERYFNGFISRFYQSGSDANFSYYRAEMVPWFWFLTLTAGCRIFQNMSVPDIIEQVFSDFGFSDFRNDLHGSFPERIYCVQYRETAFAFLSRLMEEEGIFYFFVHEQGKHTLVLGNTPQSHAPCPSQDSVRYQGSTAGVQEEDVISDWEIHQELRPGKYALTDYNFEMPATSLMANISGKGDYEVYDYPGEYQQKADGENLVKIRLESLEAAGLVVRGASTCRCFSSGFRFDLTEHYRKDMNTSWLLTAVRHQAVENSYVPDNAGGNTSAYENEFTAIPHRVPYRPDRITVRPVVQGPQTAVVVGPADEEIWVDPYGRVKVQFHWDREGQKDENSSCWIRVAQSWAGKRWGIIFIPRIGQEVIVDFLEGDPDQPIITGRVYNAEQMPPYDLPADQTKSTIKTRSSKGGSPDNFNEIRFEDKKGEEEVYIHAEKDLNSIVENDETRNVGHDRTTTIENDETITVKGHRTEKVEKNENYRVVGDRMETVEGSRHLVVKTEQIEKIESNKHIHVTGDNLQQTDGNVALKVGSNTALESGQEIHLKAGMSLVLEAGMEVTIKAGGSFLKLDPSGLTIMGSPMVKLNSGGAPGNGSGLSGKPAAASEAETG